MRYNIRDKITIRSLEWFEECKQPNNNDLGDMLSPMKEYCGLEATILSVENKNRYSFIYDRYFSIISYKISIDGGLWDWQDYMFDNTSYITRNYLLKYCNNICKFKEKCEKDCYLYNYIYNNFPNIGDLITIKSIDWYYYNENSSNIGKFNKEMSNYCGNNATITNIHLSENNVTYYNIDLDNGKNIWYDYMFDVNIQNTISKICKLQCINDYCSKCIFNNFKL